MLGSVFKDEKQDDRRNEPMSYRTAFAGIVLGSLFLLCFSWKAGMSAWVAVCFFFGYFVISLSLTRIRAELGAPIISLWVWGERSGGPGQKIVQFLGTRQLGHANLTILSLFFWFNRDHRAHPMPHQLEGFELGKRT